MAHRFHLSSQTGTGRPFHLWITATRYRRAKPRVESLANKPEFTCVDARLSVKLAVPQLQLGAAALQLRSGNPGSAPHIECHPANRASDSSGNDYDDADGTPQEG